MGFFPQSTAFRSLYTNKFISLINKGGQYGGQYYYEACKDTPDEFCMFSFDRVTGELRDSEGHWMMQSLDDPTIMTRSQGEPQPPHGRFSFSKNELGNGTQLYITTQDPSWIWVVDGQCKLGLAPYLGNYRDPLPREVAFEFWDSRLFPWPPT
jgi:hypothetical protein